MLTSIPDNPRPISNVELVVVVLLSFVVAFWSVGLLVDVIKQTLDAKHEKAADEKTNLQIPLKKHRHR